MGIVRARDDSCNNAVQRCQVHKGRNILEHLPEAQRPWVKAVCESAWNIDPFGGVIGVGN